MSQEKDVAPTFLRIESASTVAELLSYMTGGIHLRVKVNGKGAEVGSPRLA